MHYRSFISIFKVNKPVHTISLLSTLPKLMKLSCPQFQLVRKQSQNLVLGIWTSKLLVFPLLTSLSKL